ncbi:hypothetical protein D6779_08635 [Candidatus Parcubacteria bacterium]|nr:MAG: hypothetical protein D6779_08635 [Candidatus Parcubacteria bacterium]
MREAAFWLGVLIGLSLFGVLFVLAPLVGLFFDESRLTPVLRLIGLQIPLSSISMIPLAWMKRAFQFRRYALIQLASSLVMILVAVWGGMKGWGYWAYVVGLLSGSVLMLVLTLLFLEWRPGWHIHWRWWGKIGQFSAFVLAEMVLGWLFVWLDNVIVARQLGSEAAGVYSLAFNIATTTIALPLSAITGVALPVFSRLQSDPGHLREVYLRLTGVIAALALPVAFGLVLFGPPLLRLVYPQRWESLGVLLPALALYAGFGHLWILNGDAFKAIGRPELMVKIYLPMVAITFPLYWWSSQHGLVIFTYSRSLVVVVGAVLHTWFAVQYLRLKKSYVLEVIYPPLFAALLAGWGVVMLMFLRTHYLHNLQNRVSFLWIAALWGSVLYGGVLYKIFPDFTETCVHIFSLWRR